MMMIVSPQSNWHSLVFN